jgi:hypothetical protein
MEKFTKSRQILEADDTGPLHHQMAPKKPGAAPAAQDAVDPLPALFDEVLRFAQQDDNERVAKAADKSGFDASSNA